MEFGTDALAPAMLERLRKGFTAEEAMASARTCRSAGLPQCHHLIFGTPGETESTVSDTLERAEAMAPDAIIAMCGVRVYPGTALARELLAGDPDPPDLLDPYHHVAPGVAGILEARLLDHARRHRCRRIQALGWGDLPVYALWGQAFPRSVYEAVGFRSIAEVDGSPLRALPDMLAGRHGALVQDLVERQLRSTGLTPDSAECFAIMQLDLR